jgi:hypothetical protein
MQVRIRIRRRTIRAAILPTLCWLAAVIVLATAPEHALVALGLWFLSLLAYLGLAVLMSE